MSGEESEGVPARDDSHIDSGRQGIIRRYLIISIIILILAVTLFISLFFMPWMSYYGEQPVRNEYGYFTGWEEKWEHHYRDTEMVEPLENGKTIGFVGLGLTIASAIFMIIMEFLSTSKDNSKEGNDLHRSIGSIALLISASLLLISGTRFNGFMISKYLTGDLGYLKVMPAPLLMLVFGLLLFITGSSYWFWSVEKKKGFPSRSVLKPGLADTAYLSFFSSLFLIQTINIFPVMTDTPPGARTEYLTSATLLQDLSLFFPDNTAFLENFHRFYISLWVLQFTALLPLLAMALIRFKKDSKAIRIGSFVSVLSFIPVIISIVFFFLFLQGVFTYNHPVIEIGYPYNIFPFLFFLTNLILLGGYSYLLIKDSMPLLKNKTPNQDN